MSSVSFLRRRGAFAGSLLSLAWLLSAGLQAGQNPFQRMLQGGEFGTQMAQQGDVETQRRLQLLGWLLGTSQGASFNVPFTQQPSLLDSLGQLASIPGSFLGGGNKRP